jgi:predicted aldo/keto reductase-like oxidoreductase
MCGGCEGACPRGLDVSTLVRCDECDGCAIACPNGVRVREQLIRARTLFA